MNVDATLRLVAWIEAHRPEAAGPSSRSLSEVSSRQVGWLVRPRSLLGSAWPPARSVIEPLSRAFAE